MLWPASARVREVCPAGMNHFAFTGFRGIDDGACPERARWASRYVKSGGRSADDQRELGLWRFACCASSLILMTSRSEPAECWRNIPAKDRHLSSSRRRAESEGASTTRERSLDWRSSVARVRPSCGRQPGSWASGKLRCWTTWMPSWIARTRGGRRKNRRPYPSSQASCRRHLRSIRRLRPSRSHRHFTVHRVCNRAGR